MANFPPTQGGLYKPKRRPGRDGQTQPNKQTHRFCNPGRNFSSSARRTPTHPPSRRWRRWRWTSRSPRRRRPATRPRQRRRGGAAAEARASASTTCSTSTTCSSRSGRRPTTSTASRPSATTSTPEVTFLLDSARPRTLVSMCLPAAQTGGAGTYRVSGNPSFSFV